MCQITVAVRKGNVVREDGEGEKQQYRGMIHARTQGRMKPCTSARSVNVRDGRCTFLTRFGVPTRFTFLGYSTFENIPKFPSVGEHGKEKKKRHLSLSPFKQGK